MANQQLFDYIKLQLQQHTPKEIIFRKLLAQGWQQQDINEAFSQTTEQSATVPETLNNLSAGDPTKNSRATIGLILGIVGLVAWFIPLIGAPVTITGLIFSKKGLRSLKRKLAIAGIVLSSIGLLATLINASIGAYQGATKQINFINQTGQKAQNETTQTLQPTQQPTQKPAVTQKTTQSQSTQQPATPQKVSANTLSEQAYSDTKHGFKINPPKGWRVDTSGQDGKDLVLFSNFVTDQNGTDVLHSYIDVVSESLQGYSLNDYMNDGKSILSKSQENYKLIEDRSVVVNGLQSRILEGSFEYKQGQSQDGLRFRELRLVTAKGGQVYAVIGVINESVLDQYKNLIESSLLTFNLN